MTWAPDELLEREVDEVDALRARVAELEGELRRVREVVGEGWFAGDVDTPTAVARKCRVLEGHDRSVSGAQRRGE